MTSLSDRRALVTGGTRGIGYAIAAELLVRGAQVTVTGTTPDGAGPDGTAFEKVDFADVDELTRFAVGVASGGFDILINNAGINKIGPFAEYDPGMFERIQQINVHAPFRICQAVVPGMKARGWGRIVNISSIWGKISKSGRSAYSTSKFGLDGMTLALAAEVAADGILANCVAPGFIDTELTRRVLSDSDIASLVAQVPAGRLGKVEEIATFVAWLAGPENTYICCQNIAVDGGFTRV